MRSSLSLTLALLAGCAIGPGAFAQTQAGLDIHMYAGLSITGAVGTVYSVDYVTDLAQTNTPSAWLKSDGPMAIRSRPSMEAIFSS